MQMAEWRKSTFPKCPKCERGGTHTGHRNCPQNGKLWVDILTGTQKCDACGQSWSLEKSIHHCSCGAKFQGGQLWQGMATELGSYADLVWLKRLGISKGTLQTEFLGWWKEPHESKKDDNRSILPLVISLIIWFAMMWAAPYFLPNENEVNEACLLPIVFIVIIVTLFIAASIFKNLVERL